MSEKLVKVIANYSGYTSEVLEIWGVTFKLINGKYVAEISQELANEMIKNCRVTKA